MSASLLEREMASEGKEFTSVRLEIEAVRLARAVSGYRGQSLSEYCSAVLLEAAKRDWKAMVEAEHSQKEKPRRRPKSS